MMDVLFNDTLNTFYILLKTIQIMREDICYHTSWAIFLLGVRYFCIHHHTDWIVHISALVTPVVEVWLERMFRRSEM